MRAKFVGLESCAVCEFGACQTGWESEIIFDSHAGAGLAARSGRIQYRRAQPLEAPYTAAAKPAGPAPTTSRSKTVCSSARWMPTSSANVLFDGFRKSSMCAQATTGVSASVTPKLLRSWSTCGSVSRSVQVKSTRFLDRKSRTRKVSRRITRPDHTQADEIWGLAQQLATGDKSLKNDVAQAGTLVQHMAQGFSRDFEYLAVARAMAVKIAGVPVKCEISPVNSPLL